MARTAHHCSTATGTKNQMDTLLIASCFEVLERSNGSPLARLLPAMAARL
jgi:hypothetical protein